MTEDSKSKQRLVGATVLLSLAVIFLPVLVDYQREPDPAADVIVAPPAPAYRDYQSRVVPIKMPTLADSHDQGAISRAVQGESVPIDDGVSAPQKAPPEARSPTAAGGDGAGRPVAPVRPLNKGWVVQVGTFSTPGSAEKVRSELSDRGFIVFIEPLQTPNDTLQRVRIGPQIDRNTAEAALEKLQQSTEYSGVVLRFP